MPSSISAVCHSRTGKRSLIAACVLAGFTFVGDQAFSAPCGADICIYDTIPTPTPQSGGGGSTTVYSGGPKEIAQDLNALDRAINSVANWIGSLLPRSTAPVRSSDPGRFTAPRGQAVSVPAQSPNSETDRADFTRKFLDGANLRPLEARQDPYAHSLETLTTPPAGVDPTRSQATVNREPSQSIADPIDLGTGAFTLRHVDLSMPGSTGTLEFVRTYSSRSPGRSILGSNWTYNFDTYARKSTTTNAPRNITGLDLASRDAPFWVVEGGRGRLFYKTSFGYVAGFGSPDVFVETNDGFELRKPDGRILHFDSDGDLVEDRDRFGNAFHFEYEPVPLWLIYRTYCTELANEKPCRQLAYAFGEAPPREFVHQTPWGAGRDFFYVEEIVNPGGLRQEVSDDAIDPDRRNLLRSLLGAGLVQRLLLWGSGNDTEDAIRFSFADELTTDARARTLFKLNPVVPAKLGRYSRRLFEALRANKTFQDDAGTLRDGGTTSEEDARIRNFNAALICEVFIPRQCQPLFDYESAPAFESDASGRIPYRALGSDWPTGATPSARAKFDAAHAELAAYRFQPDGTPTARTRATSYGMRRKRLTSVSDASGRNLTFEYYSATDQPPHLVGLLKAVRGPVGVRVEYEYVAPWFIPHFLNEVFLKVARRDDGAVTFLDAQKGLRRAAARNYLYEYAWQDAEARWFQDWAWLIWQRLAKAGDPSAPWAAGQYLSESLDNIIRVWRNNGTDQNELEVELLYQSNPLSPDFDRVIEQRYGSGASASAMGPVNVAGYTVMHWRSQAPRQRFQYGLASIQLIEEFLPSEIRERYPLEPLPTGFVSHPRSPFYPYFSRVDVAATERRLMRSRVSADQITGLSRYIGYDLHAVLGPDAPNTPQPQPGLEPLRTNSIDSYRAIWAGGTNAEGIWFSESTAEVDATRITSWVKSIDRESHVSYFGLNSAGLPLVTARAAPNDLMVIGDEYLYEEHTYDGHGRLTSTRYPTPAFTSIPDFRPIIPRGSPVGNRTNVTRVPRRVTARADTRATYRYPEPLLGAEFKLERWLARFNLLETRDLPAGGSVPAFDGSTSVPVNGLYRALFYEPVYQQPLLMELGALEQQEHHRFFYQLAWHFCDGDRMNAASVGAARRLNRDSRGTKGMSVKDFAREVDRLARSDRGTLGEQARALKRARDNDPGGLGRWPIAANALFPAVTKPLRDWLEQHDMVSDSNGCSATRPSRLTAAGGPLFVGGIARISDSARVLQFSWNAAGLPTQVAERGGTVTDLEYFANGDSGEITKAGIGFLGRRTVHSSLHTADGPPGPAEPPCQALAGALEWVLPWTCVDPLAELRTLGLDDSAITLVTAAVDDAARDVEEFSYFSTGHLRRSTLHGRETGYVRDADGQILETHRPGRAPWQNEFSLRGQPTRTTIGDPAAPLWERLTTYDAEGRPTAITDQPAVGGWRTSLGYSPEGRLATALGGEGVGTDFSYDVLGRLTSIRQNSSQPNVAPLQSNYEYDDLGRTRRFLRTSGSSQSAGPSLTETLEYDGFGRLNRYVDPQGLATTYNYNARGLVTSVIHWTESRPGAPSVPYRTVRYEYDEHGELISTAGDGIDTVYYDRTPRGLVWRERRDGLGERYSTFDPAGRPVWQRSANGVERIVIDLPGQSKQLEVTVQPGLSRRATFSLLLFDDTGRLREWQRSANGTVTHESWQYDDLGRVASTTNERGEQLLLSYDAFGHVSTLQSVAPHDAAGSSNIARLGYDSSGRRASLTDPAGQTTRWRYDGFGRLVSEERPNVLKPTTYRYDDLGRLASSCVYAASCLRYRYDRGRLGNIDAAADHSGPSVPYTALTYDTAGRLQEATAFNTAPDATADPTARVTQTFEYADFGRSQLVTTKIGPSGSPKSVNSVVTSSAGTIDRNIVIDGAGSWLYKFDTTGRPVQILRPDHGPAFALHWNGRELESADAQLDEENLVRETRRFDDRRLRTSSSWTRIDGTASGANPNLPFIEEAIARFSDGRVAADALAWPAAKLVAIQAFTYDERGRWTAMQSGLAPPGTDIDGLLAGAATGAIADAPWLSSRTIERSLVGSALVVRDGAGDSLWTATRGPGLELHAVTADANWQALNDGTGRAARAGSDVYAYDAWQLLRTISGTTSQDRFLYDAFGRLAARADGTGLVESFVYDDSRPIAAYNQSGALRWEALWAPDGSLRWWRGGADPIGALVISDRRQTPRALWRGSSGGIGRLNEIDPDGRVTSFGADGQVICGDSELISSCAITDDLPFGLTGAWRAPTGLLNFGTRWYSPGLREFLTPDPEVYADTYDPRGYARFDPVNRSDPSGRSSGGFLDQYIGYNLAFASGVGQGVGELTSSLPLLMKLVFYSSNPAAIVETGVSKIFGTPSPLVPWSDASDRILVKGGQWLQEQSADLFHQAESSGGHPTVLAGAAFLGVMAPNVVGGPESAEARVVAGAERIAMSDARLAQLLAASESKVARCVACDRRLFEAFDAARAAVPEGLKAPWQAFRSRINNLLPELEGIPIHHWFYTRREYPALLLDPANHFVLDPVGHALTHRAVGIEGSFTLQNGRTIPAAYFRMEYKQPELIELFRFATTPRDAAARDLAEGGASLLDSDIANAIQRLDSLW